MYTQAVGRLLLTKGTGVVDSDVASDGRRASHNCAKPATDQHAQLSGFFYFYDVYSQHVCYIVCLSSLKLKRKFSHITHLQDKGAVPL